MKLGRSQTRALISAPALLVAASCVPAGIGLQASALPVPEAAPVEVAAAAVATPAWAKLEPGMPYRTFERRIAAAAPFSVESSEADDQARSLECLAKTIYYEARSETEDGQRAVAQVVLNRVRHPAYPNSVCGVVYQGSHLRTGCQFTFTCDGSLRYGTFGPSWDRARRLAAEALSGEVYGPVGTATHYHTTAILPYWASSLTRSAVVGAHVFYRWRGRQGLPEAFTQRYAGTEPGSAPAEIASDSAPTVFAAVAATPVAVESGVRRWHSATPEVRIHRGSAALPAAAPAADAAAATEVALTEPQAGSFGVNVHRSSGSVPVS
jgi:spore germination cell wall hydrolase CwlJ-like protein